MVVVRMAREDVVIEYREEDMREEGQWASRVTTQRDEERGFDHSIYEDPM